MSEDELHTSGLEKKHNCIFCNVQLGLSARNCLNIFKTIILPLGKKTCDIIGSLLEVDVSEKDSVHSEFICKKCFKSVKEFADLEAKTIEIKSKLNSLYARTSEYLTEETETMLMSASGSSIKKSGFVKRKVKIQTEDGGQVIVDMKGNMIMQAEGTDDDDEKPKVFVVEDGEVGEIQEVEQYEIGEVIEDMEMENAEMDEGDEGVGEEPDEEEEEEEEEGAVTLVKTEMEEGEELQVRHVEMEGGVFTCLQCTAEEPHRKPFNCEAKDVAILSLHLKVDHGIRVCICDICGAEFRKRNDLSAHVDEHVNLEEGDFQCEVCNRIFSNLRLFRIHKRLHSAQNKTWGCEKCGKKYSSRNLLEEHFNIHTGNRPYVCPSCGKDFASKYTFKAHMKTHEARERNFSCSSCEKTFLSAQNLIQHEKTHSESKDYVCKTCGKGFSSMRNLDVHNVVHSGLKPFMCKVCGKAFARKAEIKDHERTHTGERPFQCEFCGAQFSQRSNLQSHKRVTHYDDRRYRCDVCNKGFKRRRLLDYHVKAAHTGERPHKCITCDATFVYPEHYKKHVRIHSGIKPYKCEVCGKAFNSRDNRNAHRFVHSDKKPYECLVCGMGFMRKPLLYNHMQQVGHINDTIVVNQPRLATDEEGELGGSDREGDIEMTIVDDNGQVIEQKPKLYLTELNQHVIIQGNEKTLFMADGTKIKALTEDDEEHLVDGETNFVDIDGNIIEIGPEHLVDENSIAVTAHINEHGQLVNEQGQLISEHGQILTDFDGQSLIVDETVLTEDGIIIKEDKSEEMYAGDVEGQEEEEEDEEGTKQTVHYVLKMPDGAQQTHKGWFNIVENDVTSN